MQAASGIIERAHRALREGRVEEARALLEKVPEGEREGAGALHVAGLLAEDEQKGVGLLRRAISLAPDEPAILYDLGRCLFKAARYEQADRAFARVLTQRPVHPRALAARGNVCMARGRFADAIAFYEEASRIRPDIGEPHNNRGVCLLRLGRVGDALDAFLTAVRAEPDLEQVHFNLARHALRERSHRAVIAAYRELCSEQPHAASLHGALGRLLLSMGAPRAALSSLRQALALAPDRTDLLRAIGQALLALDLRSDARRYLSRGLETDREDAALHYLMALALPTTYSPDAIHQHLQRALELDPDLLAARVRQALQHLSEGSVREALSLLEQVRTEAGDLVMVQTSLARVHDQIRESRKARELVLPLVRKTPPDPSAVLTLAHLVEGDVERREVVDRLRSLLKRGLQRGTRRAVLFELGRQLDRLGDFDEAFAVATRANALRRVHYDRDEAERGFERLIAVFSESTFKRLSRTRSSLQRPVFIVGMPRSGTTMTEQILDRHPDAWGAGELGHIHDLMRRLPERVGVGIPWPEVVGALEARHLKAVATSYLEASTAGAPDGVARIVDKMPHNFLALGLIALALPDAFILHCVRDPRNTCVSLWFQDFAAPHPYAYDLGDLGHYHRLYQELMRHWKELGIEFLDARYEEMVSSQEASTRALLAHVDLPWDPVCLDFHEAERVVLTASSHQVREPLYSRSIGRWRNYERHLDPLLEALSR